MAGIPCLFFSLSRIMTSCFIQHHNFISDQSPVQYLPLAWLVWGRPGADTRGRIFFHSKSCKRAFYELECNLGVEKKKTKLTFGSSWGEVFCTYSYIYPEDTCAIFLPKNTQGLNYLSWNGSTLLLLLPPPHLLFSSSLVSHFAPLLLFHFLLLLSS